MNKYVYILTDCNRSCLHVGYTEDLLKTVDFHKEKRAIFFGSRVVTTRLIYFEEYSSEELALARFNQMCTFTRPQKENLIRSANPNWTDLAIAFALEPSYHPGAKFRPNVPNLTSFR